MKRFYFLLALLALVVLAYVFKPYIRTVIAPVTNKFTNSKTIADRLGQFGEAARARWKPYFSNAQTVYPPANVKLVAVKLEHVLEVYAGDKSGSNHWIRSYPILAASGDPGPKLREGDGQVPEGIYPIESLNPNSLFHVALRVGYPNDFDRLQASKEGRTNLGGDIMIHGNSVSIGCLAMGNEAAEDLFVLAADTGLKNVTVIITPVDFRKGKSVPQFVKLPEWGGSIYSQIKSHLEGLPLQVEK
ncbi:MAG TPA: L,D-transpeptidase family protein [Verrucomicrobiae bacterium]|nr:L,D-transpeptidase family protein [Verrucomicrobiae bacterium]